MDEKERMKKINLEVVGSTTIRQHGSRLKGLTRNNNITLNFHELPSDYKISKIPIYKRIKIRKYLMKKITEAIEAQEMDNTVLFYSQPPTLLNGVLKEIKGVLRILDVRDIYDQWNHHSFFKRIIEKNEQNSTMKSVQAITYSHRGFLKYFKRDGFAKKSYFISNGADTNIFTPQGLKEKLKGDISLVCCGTINPYNRIENLIRIMRNISFINEKIHLTIIGYGNDSCEKKVISAINTGTLQNTTFINQNVSQEFIASCLRGADYTISAISPASEVMFNATIPNKIYESLACGTPVLSIGGLSIEKLLQKFNSSYNFDLSQNNISIEYISHAIANMKNTPEITRFNTAKKAFDLFSYDKIGTTFRKTIDYLLETLK